MEEKRIEVLIARDGTVKIIAHGYSGPACEQATKSLEDAMGKVVEDERTSEFWQEDLQKVDQ